MEPEKSSYKGLIITVAALVVVVVALYWALFGVPGSSFRGLANPGASSNQTTPTINLDGTYEVDVTTQVQIPIADDPTANPDTYGLYAIQGASVTVQGQVVTLTLTKLCFTFEDIDICVPRVPITWTGTLSGNTAVLQDPDHPVSWVTVTLADGQATLSRTNDPPCLLPDNSTAGAGNPVGSLHFYCGA